MPRLSIAVVLGLSAVATVSHAQDRTDEWTTPRVHVALSGGTSRFRGGEPGLLIPFQPDTNAPTAGGTIAFRLARHLALEGGVAGAWGREENGSDTPDNTFATAGFKMPIVASGRLVPYVTVGGALVSRGKGDEVSQILERAFAVSRNEKAAYAGAGLEWRLTRLLGLRGDYRYFRVFPKDVEDIGTRDSFSINRILGGVTFSF